ncbi:hypothetical protein B2G88_15945 [Natronolimnobius baerhuensis]|uniref:Uncharacterized protein n=2 Tax=Natronolimnobius baerhuensis TaxID=253108 RepID=A0A202E6K8_9EURY|nr:hypothetical protein B2G88_15945 [Natronolimnobius baerhuensis]
MAQRSSGLPSTTAWALASAGAVGSLALIVFDPTIALGVASGLVLAAVISGFDGPYWRVAVAAALLPVAIFGVIGAIATGSQLLTGGVTIIAVVIAVATGRVVAGDISDRALNQLSGASVTAGFTAGLVGLGGLLVADAGGWSTLVEATLWFSGTGLVGVFVWAIAGAFALACAVTVLPAGSFVPPTDHESYLEVRTGLLAALAVSVVLFGVGLAGLIVASWYVPLFGDVLETITTSWIVRGVGALVTALGVLLIVFAISVRHSWLSIDARRNAAVPLIAGSALGVFIAFTLTLSVSGGSLETVSPLFGLGSVVLGVGWLIGQAGRWVERESSAASAAVLAVALVAGGVVTGATVTELTTLEGVRTAAVSLVMIAAGLFAYDLSRYGRTLARDIGPTASPRPQFVRAGWSALVAGLGVPVAAFGLVVATLFAPTLSVPATAAVIVALGALVIGTRLLFR